MRLLHTADWHLGRRLKGVDRTPEIAGALSALLAAVDEHRIDAVLVAGDLFDQPNPPAEAERAAYAFFMGLAKRGVPAVVIAGNHDSATRFDATAPLLALAGVSSLGRPRPAAAGGVVRLETASGPLTVAALPFASERRLLSADELWAQDAVEQRAGYRQAIAHLLGNLAAGAQGPGVHVAMAHLAMDSAKLSHSEQPFYTRDAYSLAEAILPATMQYVALGHIHTPQALTAAAPTRYSGSLIQVDFGEVDEAKGYQLIEVEPGRPASATFMPLSLEKPLKQLRVSEHTLDATLEAHRHFAGYLKVVVDLEAPMAGLAERVRRICPQALHVEPRYPERPAAPGMAFDPSRSDPAEAFGRFYAEKLGAPLDPGVAAAFGALYEEHAHAPA